MSEDINEVPAISEEYDTILPEGWAVDDDIFDVDSWSGEQDRADESDAGDGEGEVTETGDYEYDASTTGDDEGYEESGEDDENAPTNEQNGDLPKLRFRAQIDHRIEDVELDEDELPTIYQKAHVTDRVRAKLDKVQPVLDKGARLAKILGYDSMDDMLNAAEQSYRDGEVERLKEEGVHPDVAQELVESRTKRAVESLEEADEDDGEEEQQYYSTRDYRSEVSVLLDAHPELRGTQLPNEVVNACVVEGRPLVSAYEAYIRRQTEAENRAVKAENKRLKQNADAARRAPVRGVSRGGQTDVEPDDPFLIGFNAGRW